jgi:hypothetical protein
MNCELNSSGSDYGAVACSCERGSVPPASIWPPERLSALQELCPLELISLSSLISDVECACSCTFIPLITLYGVVLKDRDNQLHLLSFKNSETMDNSQHLVSWMATQRGSVPQASLFQNEERLALCWSALHFSSAVPIRDECRLSFGTGLCSNIRV